MNWIIGIGVYLLLASVVIVAIITVFQSIFEKRPSSQGTSNNLAPLTALAAIAEEAHRHPSPDLHALPWTPASPLAPMGDALPQALPLLAELVKRVERLEELFDRIGAPGEASANKSSEPLRLS